MDKRAGSAADAQAVAGWGSGGKSAAEADQERFWVEILDAISHESADESSASQRARTCTGDSQLCALPIRGYGSMTGLP